ncbi:MAG: tetratricopeptide repeat protein, partial [Marinirhabdus sp.]
MAGSAGSDVEKLGAASEAYVKAKKFNDNGKYTDRIGTGISNLRIAMEKSAMADFQAKNYSVAANKFYASYRMNPTDTIYLMNAALSAKEAKDYDSAITYYKQLMELGYTGITEQYVATEKETGKEQVFTNPQERDLYVKAGTHTAPTVKVSKSRKEENMRALAVLYLETGNNDKAMQFMKKLRAANPNDIALIRAEADLVYKLGDMDRYKKLMQEIIASDPNNPEIYFNLGVGAAETGDTQGAIKYYKEALRVDPDYAAANINLAATILASEEPIIEEMNNLGNSAADNKRYDALKAQRTDLYRSALPYMEKAQKLRPDNVELMRTLMNLYAQTGNEAKRKTMKAKLETLTGGK